MTHRRVNEGLLVFADIERLREGQVGAQFWSTYVPCSNNLTRSSEDVSLTMIDHIKRVVAAYQKAFGFAKTAKEVSQIFSSGRIASLIEGGHSINNDISVLRLYFELGVRYMTLTHACNTNLGGVRAGSVRLPERSHAFRRHHRDEPVGKKVIRRVLDFAKAPVLFSHSSARAIFNRRESNRKLPDDVLLLLPTHGVIMINHATDFVCADAQGRVALASCPSHRAHTQPYRRAGLEDVSMYPNLMAELLRRGFSDSEVSGIIGGNLLLVMIRGAATKLRREGLKPVEDRLDVIKSC
ncbi:hypothetical protein BJ742DRAFT_777043 [Cladochytrium replicatum]|nr:hypothetical protein BJ742DRAFT_777043 [Cladochytrium replicatum]